MHAIDAAGAMRRSSRRTGSAAPSRIVDELVSRTVDDELVSNALGRPTHEAAGECQGSDRDEPWTIRLIQLALSRFGSLLSVSARGAIPKNEET